MVGIIERGYILCIQIDIRILKFLSGKKAVFKARLRLIRVLFIGHGSIFLSDFVDSKVPDEW